jgi:hypothetical protein
MMPINSCSDRRVKGDLIIDAKGTFHTEWEKD